MRLANLAGRKRGRPPGFKNRVQNGVDSSRDMTIPNRRRHVVSDDEEGDAHADQTVGMALEARTKPADPTPPTRKRGRPPGAKNKVTTKG